MVGRSEQKEEFYVTVIEKRSICGGSFIKKSGNFKSRAERKGLSLHGLVLPLLFPS